MQKLTNQQCVECGKEDDKYKCPTCRAPYCSLSCCKKHKVCTQLILKSL